MIIFYRRQKPTDMLLKVTHAPKRLMFRPTTISDLLGDQKIDQRQVLAMVDPPPPNIKNFQFKLNTKKIIFV